MLWDIPCGIVTKNFRFRPKISADAIFTTNSVTAETNLGALPSSPRRGGRGREYAGRDYVVYYWYRYISLVLAKGI
jgi:hypothetical protein